MNLKKDCWLILDYIDYLMTFSDSKYLEFNKKLITSKYKFIGIRMPILRKIAKQIATGNIISFLSVAKLEYYEDVLIQGILITYLKDPNQVKEYLNTYVNYIDNWAINDTLASSLKIVKKNKEEFFVYFFNMLDSNQTYHLRLAIVVFLKYYIDSIYLDKILNKILEIQTDQYYVNMAIAWLFAEVFVYNSSIIYNILENKKISKFIFNKTISKIRDSHKVSQEDKNKCLKIKMSKIKEI